MAHFVGSVSGVVLGGVVKVVGSNSARGKIYLIEKKSITRSTSRLISVIYLSIGISIKE